MMHQWWELNDQRKKNVQEQHKFASEIAVLEVFYDKMDSKYMN